VCLPCLFAGIAFNGALLVSACRSEAMRNGSAHTATFTKLIISAKNRQKFDKKSKIAYFFGESTDLWRLTCRLTDYSMPSLNPAFGRTILFLFWFESEIYGRHERKQHQ
jgi:hypothetical protein